MTEWHTAQALLCAIILFVAYHVCAHLLWTRINEQLPPGPRPIPLLGNVHQLPSEYLEKKFAVWSSTYGDVIYARFFATHALILNSLKSAHDLLDKRSSKYSGRPYSVMQRDLLGWEPFIVFLDYGNLWKKHRRWVHGALNDKASLQTWQSVQRREVAVLLSSLNSDPDAYREHLGRYSSALIMETVYGHTVTSSEDEYVHIMDMSMKLSTQGETMSASMVDFIPMLKYLPTWMPGADFKRKAQMARPIVRGALRRPYYMVKALLASGSAKPSIVTSLIEESIRKGTLEEDETDIIFSGGALYGPGIDTTNSVMATFFLAMTLYPEILHKAQEEVDRVVGPDRLPDFSDRDSLPYIGCIVKETYRWIPPLPLGIPHLLTGEDEYMGYKIPKGTTIIPNIWRMSHNEEMYPNPHIFRPERFTEMNPQTAEHADPFDYVFGFGRRICPGRQFADASVWLAIANIIAMMDISKKKDSTGKEIIPDVIYPSGFIVHVLPFPCTITPRSMKAEGVISQAQAVMDAL
ncbi:cytochrome P450 [Wolfiporia cocos MD-104 SS10]|uniref:Cytochrome P450 n=1 Tax=Wolfiporia cocos (strain MD-104) TaxID=742152 RepID=A0A2H3JTH2_WOLCO|nr:cytochrome P450 [Wolfiporia cocos MD-104 SS10]